MMTKYRHREKGYEVKAIEHPGAMYVGGYHGITTGCIYLATEDFNKLFEPIKEESYLAKRKIYKHKEDGYEITANYCKETDRYTIHDYRRGDRDCSSFTLEAKDFEKLFEPIEEYCCPEFKDLVRKGFIYKDVWGRWTCMFGASWGAASQHKLVSYCPVCGKKPL